MLRSLTHPHPTGLRLNTSRVLQDSLCNFALSEADRQRSQRDAEQVRTHLITFYSRHLADAHSTTQGFASELPPADPQTLPSIRRRIDKYAVMFHEEAVSLASVLAVHPDQVGHFDLLVSCSPRLIQGTGSSLPGDENQLLLGRLKSHFIHPRAAH